MMKKRITRLLLVMAAMMCVIQAFGQNKPFVTIWKPSNESSTIPDGQGGNLPQSGDNAIYFPGIGTNYTIEWEEVDYESHHGTLPNITTTAGNPVLIDFGTPSNPTPAAATYRVKVYPSGFEAIRYGSFNGYDWDCNGDTKKLISIDRWGDVAWTSMFVAFHGCSNLTGIADGAGVPNLSGVTDMMSMFDGARAFNGDISGWDVSNVTYMSSMFNGARAFNGDISGWDVSNVTSMSSMFNGARAFNGDISGWDVSNVTYMSGMFQHATAFNQSLDSWDVNNVTDMWGMFQHATAFNQPLGSWNVSNVTKMSSMFNGATAFNQSLDSWDVSKVTDMSYMLDNCGMDCKNYDATLQGWAALPSLQSGVKLGAEGLSYGATGKTARETLTAASHNWEISGDSYDANCSSTGVIDLESSHTQGTGVSFYPNPAKDVVRISLGDNVAADKAMITDLSGKVLLLEPLSGAETSINVSGLSKGVYLIRVGTYTGKLVIK